MKTKAFIHSPALCGFVLALGLDLAGATAPAAASFTLIASSSTWRYLDDGSDQGAAWRGEAFDDSGWSSGVAPVGYGLTGIATTQAMARVTYYHRKTFEVSALGAYSDLIVRLCRDDGGIVYINGTEVFRSNMPAGEVDFITLAIIPATGASQFTFFSNQVPTSVLVPGLNQVAVEIHQAGTNSVDAAFNLELTASADITPPSVTLANPINGATFIAGDNILLGAEATDDSGVAQVEFYANGLLVGTETNVPYAATLGNARFGNYALTSVAQDLGGLRATSAPVMIEVTFDTNAVTLVANRACWNYWDQGADPGPDWMSAGFDDIAWPLGFAELGYGDGDEATGVSYGTNASNKHITTYFRRRFPVTDPAVFTNLLLRLKRDDGAVVYLNGTEVFRANLPAGPVNHLTLATPAANDGAFYITTNVSPLLLTAEVNTLAVEVHQSTNTSSDISFDLQLIAQAGVQPPVLRIAMMDALHLLLAWPASAGTNFALQSATELASPSSWTALSGLATEVSGELQVVVTLPSSTRFFRLCAASSPVEVCQPPLIVSQSLNVPAAAGSNVTLNVTAVGDGSLSYQWRKNEQIIEGANSGVLTLTNAQRESGGVYDVFVGNECGCSFSSPILVVIGGEDVTLPDDFADAFQTNSVSGQFNASNSGATMEPGEPGHPIRSFGRTVWMRWTAPADGLAEFDTLGSGQGTSLAVYSGVSLGALQLRAADGPSLPAFTSRVRFQALAGTEYHLAVDGFGQSTRLCLNWNLDAASPASTIILVSVRDETLLAGSNAVFTVSATNAPASDLTPIHYQWSFLGVPIPDATNASHTVTNIQGTNVGPYSVMVSGVGAAVSSTGFLSVVTLTGSSFRFAAASGPNAGTVQSSLGQFTGSSTCGKNKFTKARGYCFRTLQSPLVAVCPAPAWYDPVWLPNLNPSAGTGLTVSTIDPANEAFDTAVALAPVPISSSCAATCANDNGGLMYPLLSSTSVTLCNYVTVTTTAPPRVQAVVMYKVRSGFTAPAKMISSWTYF